MVQQQGRCLRGAGGGWTYIGIAPYCSVSTLNSSTDAAEASSCRFLSTSNRQLGPFHVPLSCRPQPGWCPDRAGSFGPGPQAPRRRHDRRHVWRPQGELRRRGFKAASQQQQRAAPGPGGRRETLTLCAPGLRRCVMLCVLRYAVLPCAGGQQGVCRRVQGAGAQLLGPGESPTPAWVCAQCGCMGYGTQHVVHSVVHSMTASAGRKLSGRACCLATAVLHRTQHDGVAGG